jgi:hypothetical protein
MRNDRIGAKSVRMIDRAAFARHELRPHAGRYGLGRTGLLRIKAIAFRWQ